MRKAVLILAALAISLSFLGSVSAFSYDYHTYVLGHGDVSAGYTSTSSSTYEKTSSSTDSPWGSQDYVKITKSSTDSFQPNYPAYNTVYVQPSNDYSYNNPYYNPSYSGYFKTSTGDFGYYPSDSYYNHVYADNSCSAWHCKKAYNYYDYGNDAYGQPYYYQPSWDWHSQVFNWAY